MIISSEEINKLKKIDQLINILSDRLKGQGMSLKKQNIVLKLIKILQKL